MHGIFPPPCIRFALANGSRGLPTPRPSPYSIGFVASASRFSSTFAHSTSGAALTAAQITRTAASSIRTAVREGKPRDAVAVTRSLLSTGHNGARTRPFHSSVHLKSFSIKEKLPSRLASHALVHALIREGLLMDAAAEVREMIAHGHRFHSRTVGTTISLLCNPSAPLGEGHVSPSHPTAEFTARPDDLEAARLLLTESTRLPPGPRQAFGILMTARQYRRERSQEMFSRLVDACLLQGEILLATLLFVLMIKDWQVRNVVRASKRQIEACLDSATDEASVERTEKQLINLGFPNLEMSKHLKSYCRSFVPFPSRSLLETILDHLDHHILTRNTADRTRLESIESMLLLAELLREGSLPWGNVGRLIRTLQTCPSSPEVTAGIRRQGQYMDVTVYEEVHNILQDLCLRPPDEAHKPTLDNPRLMPPLDVPSYNAMLRYSLRHRLSLKLANNLLEHMSKRREPPLSPNMQTYNTLLRASTLINRNDLAADVLDRLRERPENLQHPIVLSGSRNGACLDLRAPTKREIQEGSGYVPGFRRRIKEESLLIPPIDPSQVYAMDKCSIASYITHLVAIGRPDVAGELVFQLFPELDIQLGGFNNQAQALRNRCIARGVEYGPYVFSALLNALRKAGKTGLLERVWHLARQAERASWDLAGQPGQPEPWRLSIHAYTCVLQCYGDESRKGLMLIRGSLYEPPVLPQGESQRGQGRIYVQGWAYYLIRTQARYQGFVAPEMALRREASRKSGLLFYKTMQQEAVSVWQAFKRTLPESYPDDLMPLLRVQTPIPDEYFFNALLDIFGRRPHMQARRRSGRHSRWERKLRIARDNYARHGVLCNSYDPILLDVAKDMAAYGYELPVGFHRISFGHGYARHNVQKDMPKRTKVIPYAYPPTTPKSNQVFSLPVVKERGLPLYRTSRPPRSLKQRRKKRNTYKI
ncbi:hypothetical protein M422DRAFT_71992 [Sphaerobolus stellatus SS14]|uniref:Uncharacterized protein n=1 Tax=Sphaerobolus stellatus (strain SS14) TaxID=990650 RepID=A0A0C9ULB6_SPHS4|nr:hypothetical protein M422DRAFT_71992 [Sphaerobolus stellatus SS14]